MKTLRVRLTIRKNKTKRFLWLTPYKLTNFLNTKAKFLLENGNHIDFKVTYYKDFFNEKKDCSYSDLLWCKKAFLEEYMKEVEYGRI